MATDLIARGLASKALTVAKSIAPAAPAQPTDFVTFEQFGATGSGNDRAAFQAAIDYAVANRIPRVVALHKAYELWEPQLDDPGGSGTAWFIRNRTLRIPACDALEIDFAGATITLKGPTGGPALPGQPIPDVGFGAYWSGGLLTVTGAVGLLRIANVTANGGYGANAVLGQSVNLFSKGYVCQDIVGMGTVELDNVTLHSFAGEIMYDNSAALLIARDCHFFNSPQSCWNPNGVGRVIAYGLRAGRSIQVAEIRGGVGHEYHGGEFYEGGTGGITVIGGPDPLGGAQKAYNDPVRRVDAAPPWLTFHGTRFCDVAGYVFIGSYVRGRIETIDTGVFLAAGFASSGSLHDIDLDIVAWADRKGAYDAVYLGGAGANDGSVPHSINLNIRCGRTQLGTKNSAYIGNGFGMSGFVAATSCSIGVTGFAASAFKLDIPTGGTAPLIATDGFTEYGNSNYLGFGSECLLDPYASNVNLYPQVAGIVDAVVANADHGYSNGQRIRYTYAGEPGCLLRFARSGAGMLLPADRILRRGPDFLELFYQNGLWREAQFGGDPNPVSEQGAEAYTLAAGDIQSTVRFTAANPVAVTLPGDAAVAFPIGTSVAVWREGAGTVDFVPGAGVTIAAPGGSATVASRYALAYATKTAADRWTVAADKVPLIAAPTPRYFAPPPPPEPTPTPTPTPPGTTLIDTTTGAAAFNASPWTSNSLQTTSAGVPGPDGTGDASLLEAYGEYYSGRERVSPGERLFRARVKKGSAALFWLYADQPDYVYAGAWFDLAAGTVVRNDHHSASIIALADGWFQIEAQATVWPGNPNDAGYIGFGLADEVGAFIAPIGRTGLIYDYSLFVVN